MKFDILITCLCVILIFLLTFKLDNFQNQEQVNKKQLPDDLFTDNLDNPYGLKKQHRHHSF